MTKSIKEKARLSSIQNVLNTDGDVTADMLKVKFKFKFSYYELSTVKNYSRIGKMVKLESSKNRKMHHQNFNKIILADLKHECYKLLIESAKVLKIFDYNIVINYTYHMHADSPKKEGYISFDINIYHENKFIGKIVTPTNDCFATTVLESISTKDICDSFLKLKNDFLGLQIELSFGNWLNNKFFLKRIKNLHMMKKVIPFAYHKKFKSQYGKIPYNIYSMLLEKSMKSFMNNCTLFKILLLIDRAEIKIIFEYKHKSSVIEHSFNNPLDFNSLSVLNVLRVNNSLGFDIEDEITEENVEEVKNLLFLYNY